MMGIIYLPIRIIGIRSHLIDSVDDIAFRAKCYESDERLPSLIDSHEIISFDIFDTLVVRSAYNPYDLFSIIETKKGLPGFGRMRMNAELVANKNNHRKGVNGGMSAKQPTDGSTNGRGDAGLVEIYKEMPPEYRYLKDVELATEMDFCSANPSMKRNYDHAVQSGKKIVIASDTYFNEQEVRSILGKCGYENYHDMYISSERDSNKRDGAIYPEIVKDSKTMPGNILHIGDNIVSDHERAEQCGVDSHHYVKGSERRPRLFRTQDRTFASIHNGIVAESLLEPRPYYYEMAVSVLGPLFLSYLDWVKEEARKDGVGEIFFFSRDGYLLDKIVSDVEKRRSNYVFISRLVIRRALLAMEGVDHSLIFTTELEGKNLIEVAKALIPDLDPEGLKGTTHFDSVVGPGSEGGYDDFIKFLQARHGEYLNRQKDLLLRYLASTGLTSNRTAGIVDVGWNGSMQEGLQRLLTMNGINTSLTGYYVGIQKTPTNRRRALNNRMRAFAFFLEDPTYNVELYERFFTAPYGTVLGYEGSSEITPILDLDPDEEENHAALADLEAGLLWYLGKMQRFRDYFSPSSIRYDCLAMVEDLLSNPNYQDIENLSKLVHPDVFDKGSMPIDKYWYNSLLHRFMFRRMAKK